MIKKNGLDLKKSQMKIIMKWKKINGNQQLLRQKRIFFFQDLEYMETMMFKIWSCKYNG